MFGFFEVEVKMGDFGGLEEVALKGVKMGDLEGVGEMSLASEGIMVIEGKLVKMK
jgi:hypothetical protein